jgi:hypothetical protein
MRWRLSLSAVSLSALLAVPVPAALAAQETSVLSIQVRSYPDLRPLAGAQVILQGVGIGGITDRQGRLQVANLQPGVRSVEVRYLGREKQQVQVDLRGGQPTQLRFDLPLVPIILAEVKVRARPTRLETVGFNNRRSTGGGVFYTRADIERLRPRNLSDLLRQTSGVSVGMPGSHGYSSASFRGNERRNCPIQFYVDGTLAGFFNIDEVRPPDVEGIEIYRGAATIPPQYNQGTSLCGVIVIWTRNR